MHHDCGPSSIAVPEALDSPDSGLLGSALNESLACFLQLQLLHKNKYCLLPSNDSSFDRSNLMPFRHSRLPKTMGGSEMSEEGRLC